MDYAPTEAAACIALMRNLKRAVAGAAATIEVHYVTTALQHFEPLLLTVGSEAGAPATLGLLHELVRAAGCAPNQHHA